MKTKKALLFLSLLSIGLLASFQSPVLFEDGFLLTIRQKLEQYNAQIPQEKIYLQLDKPFYKPGEDIWLSAFVVSGPEHKPSTVSQVIYVELLDPKGGVEKLLTLPLVKGRTQGDFSLDASAPGGLYKIRAYSQWMKNFGEETFFERTIQVQKILTPRILLKLDFERKAYGAGEQVIADFEAKDLRNDPLIRQEFIYSVQLNGQAYQQKTLTTDREGKCQIAFHLPDTLNSADGLLNVVVDYEGQRESISRAVPIVLNKIDLQFFPEGGEWVENVKGKIAFKALDEFGKPADVAGEILDAQGKTVQTFRSFHQGMGAFELSARSKQTYQARITHPKGVSRRYDLPFAQAKGYTLALDTVQGRNLKMSFHAPVDREVHLVAQVRGKLCFSQSIRAQVGLNRIDIPLKDFPMGIAQITLFDHNQLARSERLVFVNADKKLHIKILSDKKEYRPREKVELTIRTLDEDSLPIPASLSLAVVDDQLISFADDKQDHILSYLLMSSDLKGKVEEPSFYFKKEEPKAARALDYVMMTQGWRRFTWKQVLEEQPKISQVPEKFGTVSGSVVNTKTGKPEVATVTLFELGKEKRSAQLKTDPYGSFTFLDVDPTVPAQVLAQASQGKKTELRIQLDRTNLQLPGQEKAMGTAKPESLDMFTVIQESPLAPTDKPTSPVEVASEEPLPTGNTNLSLTPDIQSLSEVVVVGYGTQRRRDLTGAIATVSAKEIASLPRISLDQALQGRVAGIAVTQSVNPSGNGSSLRIRGVGSSITQAPLYVLDGLPLDDQLNPNFSTLDFLQPDQIENISVVKSPDAVALFGSRAAHGAIVVQTKNRFYSPYYNYGSRANQTPVYSSVLISPRQFSQVREFYAPQYEPSAPVAERDDFRTTLYWNPNVQTDARGTAKVSFYNSDQISSFRVTAEGMAAGLAGREEYTYYTQQPVHLDAKIPPYLTFEDVIHLPVLLKNNTRSAIQGKLRVIQAGVLSIAPFDSILTLQPNETRTCVVQGTVRPLRGTWKLQIGFESQSFSDVISQEMDVQPKGFPTVASFSGKALENAYSFRINDPVPGSIKAELKAYPDIIGDLMGSIESILQEPYGCFEQTSASTYPNILALEYLRETRTSNQEVEEKALRYIKDGYKRLQGFETSQHGFEWFGHTPPHEGLTAFGLMEFLEMKKVYPGVSDALIERTQKWLLSRREGNGNFKQNTGKYGFSAASKTVNNAYLVYALSEAGVKDVVKEYERAYQEAKGSKDAYRMALLANASFNLQEKVKGQNLLFDLKQQMNKGGIGQLKAEHSIVISYGKSLEVETASLLALAVMKSDSPDAAFLTDLIQFLVSSRSQGGFGSTQATILALKALTQYARYSKRTHESGRLALYLNNQQVGEQLYAMGTRGAIGITGVEKQMKAGVQQFKVAFEDTKTPLPYSLQVTWNAYTPNTNNACKVDLKTRLLSGRIKAGQTVRLTTELRNKTAKGIPMTVALVGIPSGLSPQPWQLKEMQEKGLFDFYEVRKNYVVFYYREIAPRAFHQLHLDLKAEVPGVYQAPASSAYLYYTQEDKDWEAGEKVEIVF